MTTSRRKFLRLSALGILGAGLLPQTTMAWPKSKNGKFGLQLYTVREDMANDPKDTLEKLADMGYHYIEHANYQDRKFYGYAPKEFKKLLDDLGMKMPSGHVGLSLEHWNAKTNDFTDEWKYTIEDAATAGQDYVVSPSMGEETRTDYDQLKQLLDMFNKSGELCKKSGLRFGYHNHHFEFNTSVNSKNLYEVILNNTDPDIVTQELDIGNMLIGGAQATEILKKYPGRYELLHLKGEIKSENGDMGGDYEGAPLNEGVLDVESIIKEANRNNDISYSFIEQESYQDSTALESAEKNYEIMKDWGF